MSRFYLLAKLFISSITVFLSISVCAQHNILQKGDTLILNNEAKFWINEELSFGSGTMPDKTYSYIYEAPNSLQKLISNRKRKLLSAGYNGYKSKIVKFEKEIGHNKKDYDYSILVLEMPNGKRYWCDFASAFSNHEILTTRNNEGNMAGATRTTETTATTDDDMKKKKLLDSQKPSTPAKRSKTSTSKPVSVF